MATCTLRYLLYDRDLLSDLSRCAWESLKLFLQETAPEKDSIPDAVLATRPLVNRSILPPGIIDFHTRVGLLIGVLGRQGKTKSDNVCEFLQKSGNPTLSHTIQP